MCSDCFKKRTNRTAFIFDVCPYLWLYRPKRSSYKSTRDTRCVWALRFSWRRSSLGRWSLVTSVVTTCWTRGRVGQREATSCLSRIVWSVARGSRTVLLARSGAACPCISSCCAAESAPVAAEGRWRRTKTCSETREEVGQQKGWGLGSGSTEEEERTKRRERNVATRTDQRDEGKERGTRVIMHRASSVPSWRKGEVEKAMKKEPEVEYLVPSRSSFSHYHSFTRRVPLFLSLACCPISTSSSLFSPEIKRVERRKRIKRWREEGILCAGGRKREGGGDEGGG